LLGLLLLTSLLEGFSIFLRLDLHEPARAFFQNKFLFFSELRIRVDGRSKITITLQQAGGGRAKHQIFSQPLEDGVVGQIRIVYDLSVGSCFLGDPIFQFHKQTRILHQDFPDLFRRCGNAAGVFLLKFEGIGLWGSRGGIRARSPVDEDFSEAISTCTKT